MNHSGFGILIPFSSVALSRIVHFLFAITFASRYSISIAFDVLLPLSAPLWLVVFSTTLLWIIVFPSQQHFPPLHPSTLSMPPQIVAPHIHFPPILQCTLDLLM